MGIKVRGYASWFNNQDVMLPGSFSRFIGSGLRIPALYCHGTSDLLGSVARLEEDERGLMCYMDLFEDSSRAKELLKMHQAGVQLYMSIGFKAMACTFDEESYVRRVSMASLIEVSIVLYPANIRCLVLEVTDDTV